MMAAAQVTRDAALANVRVDRTLPRSDRRRLLFEQERSAAIRTGARLHAAHNQQRIGLITVTDCATFGGAHAQGAAFLLMQMDTAQLVVLVVDRRWLRRQRDIALAASPRNFPVAKQRPFGHRVCPANTVRSSA